MFHQHASHPSALPHPSRALTTADYGRDTERERSFGPSRDEELVPGRVVRAERGRCDVAAETGPVRAVSLPSSGTVVLLGPSGAGKSTLGNRLLGEDLPATGAVRGGDGKGRDTTAWREPVPLPHGGVLLDTPGLRGVGPHDADDGLEHTFAQISRQVRALKQSPRFTA